jgi:nucleoside-diphosphate-sugar epimerase
MSYLITGSAGFIGSSIARELLGRGKQARGIDCFTDYYPRAIKENNLKDLREDASFEFIEDDLLSTDLERLLEGVEVIFHQAAQAGVRASWGKEFEIYTANNVMATQRLLEACKGKKIRIVYASSSSVYGDTNQLPTSEDAPTAPISPYGVSKLAAEHLCRLYWKNFQLETVSLRYFTVYGPGQRPDMAFHIFLHAIHHKREIRIFGDGAQTRDFTFIDDAVNANLLAAEHGKPGAVYNIGGGHRIDVNGVLEHFKQMFGNSVKINYVDKQKGDVHHTYADTSRAQADLGFETKTELRQGLEAEAEWYEAVIFPLLGC